MADWSPTSWQSKPAGQQPNYPDQDGLARAVEELSSLPPLVTSWEIEKLRSHLAEAAEGKRFLLQGGACAERFDQCSADIITNKLKILLQMSLVLTFGLKRKIIRVGRMAGQYAKPRSADLEERDGISLPSYRGELVNGADFTAESRIPDPEPDAPRTRARGADPQLHPRPGGRRLCRPPPHRVLGSRFRQPFSRARRSIRRWSRGSPIRWSSWRPWPVFAPSEISRVKFYTSHEALLLPYEQAETRQVPRREGWYNLGTHFPWIGLRTAEIEGAHVDFFRGIRNPIGLKVGPSMTREWLLELLEILDPEMEPGRLTVIHRMGHDKVSECLPPLVEAVQRAGRTVLWCCDPMHGNTETTDSGYKTRRFENILSELEQSFDVHARSRLLPGRGPLRALGRQRHRVHRWCPRSLRGRSRTRLRIEGRSPAQL